MAQGTQARTHADQLARDGVVSIPNYLDDELCVEIRDSIDEALENGDIVVADESMDYREKVEADVPVMNKRSGEFDSGMLDIFNVDYIHPKLRAVRDDEFITDIIETATGQAYDSEHVNAYVNRSVTTTRGYHADTYSGKYKSFVYLTDVPDESYGPYSYTLGSHDPSFVERMASSLVNKYWGNPPTDAVFHDESQVQTFTAPKGTLIISDQSGYHRGIPQEDGRERMLTSTAYQPVD
ncbi:hypothetical protein [Haloarcula sp. JP-L23]|uniref:hypothetical protein n=1 Tax=Haloarcula sp. JP-L23 TaxID=2716717 RepID=UPI00140EF986|nr:hypothetical protein G9465_18005 [Haloarcula sp. JP-L23]